MNKTPFETQQNANNDLQPEYRFDYQNAKPNRFAERQDQQSFKVVVLDEDVAQVFTTPESVNHALRSLIAAMP